MKAVLVIDMPRDCNHCQFADFSIGHGQWECNQRGESVCEAMEICGKPSWCPLRPMPERKKMPKNYANRDYTQGLVDGWNRCWDEVTGAIWD